MFAARFPTFATRPTILATALFLSIANHSLIAGGQACAKTAAIKETIQADIPHAPKPLIQIALLLGDSGSMSGLIDQARIQLWDIIQTLGSLRHQERAQVMPRLEVAIYHYGDVPSLAQSLIHFSDDLDTLSETLFAINGGGGEEHCGEVIRSGPMLFG
jgi:hypothetical protein